METNKKGIVVAGFPGVGKSTCLNNGSKFSITDSDLSLFHWVESNDKDEKIVNPRWPYNYLRHIIDSRRCFNFVFVSTHEEIRKILEENGIPFICVIPDDTPDMLEHMIERYKKRGSSELFIKKMNDNYMEWIEAIKNDCCRLSTPYIAVSPDIYLDSLLDNIWDRAHNEDHDHITAYSSLLY